MKRLGIILSTLSLLIIFYISFQIALLYLLILKTGVNVSEDMYLMYGPLKDDPMMGIPGMVFCLIGVFTLVCIVGLINNGRKYWKWAILLSLLFPLIGFCVFLSSVFNTMLYRLFLIPSIISLAVLFIFRNSLKERINNKQKLMKVTYVVASLIALLYISITAFFYYISFQSRGDMKNELESMIGMHLLEPAYVPDGFYTKSQFTTREVFEDDTELLQHGGKQIRRTYGKTSGGGLLGVTQMKVNSNFNLSSYLQNRHSDDSSKIVQKELGDNTFHIIEFENNDAVIIHLMYSDQVYVIVSYVNSEDPNRVETALQVASSLQ